MAAPTTDKDKDRAAQKNGAAREGKAPGFDPKAHMRQLKGQDYLEARWRVVWFREENPDGQIETQIVHHDREKKEIMFRATVTVPGSGASATGYCEGCERDFKSGYVEKAETQAVGRALAFLGYGTAQASELDIGEGEKMADAPLAPRQTSAPPGQPVPAIKRVDPRRPALDRVAAEMAAQTQAQAEADLNGTSPPTPVPSARKSAWEALKAACRAIGLEEPSTLRQVNALAAQYGLPHTENLAGVTTAWLDDVRRALPRAKQSQPQGGPQTGPWPQTDAQMEQAKREQALAGWIAAAPDEATLRELRSDVMGALKLGSLTDKAAEALLEAVAGRSGELDLYPQATDGASASSDDQADAEAEAAAAAARAEAGLARAGDAVRAVSRRGQSGAEEAIVEATVSGSG